MFGVGSGVKCRRCVRGWVGGEWVFRGGVLLFFLGLCLKNCRFDFFNVGRWEWKSCSYILYLRASLIC